MTLLEWSNGLLPSDMEALAGMGYDNMSKILDADEVFELIVDWNGGMTSADEIKKLVSRVYGIVLHAY